MVTIRMFIPYLNMKNRFEAAVSRVQGQDDIRIELLHVFGTPESLSCHGDAEILVARGMTYDRLVSLFPQKHVVEIQLSSFDILEALIKARQEFSPKKIALCVRYMDNGAVTELERLCQAELNTMRFTMRLPPWRPSIWQRKAGQTFSWGQAPCAGSVTRRT